MIAAIIALLLAFQAGTHFVASRALEFDRHLSVTIGPRPMGSPAEQQALAFAAAEFLRAGCDTSYIMPMTEAGGVNTTSGIAVGIKRGAAQRSIVLGGHIDSEGPGIPGADDDGSGAACVMELAHAFGHRRMQSTLVFCCFGGEERGLRGSRHFAAVYGGLDSVALMLQIDMANGLGLIDIDPDYGRGSAPKWLVRAAIEEFNRLGYTGLRYPTHFFSVNYSNGQAGSGSDHESFLELGIPAIDFSTDVSKPIHTPRDNFQNFEPGGLERSGRLVEALVERFDGGVPSDPARYRPGAENAAAAPPPDRTERYWLYLIGTTPLFVPMWGVGAAAGMALLLAIAALIAVRRRRIDHATDVRWTTLRMIPFTLFITACGWFSSDLVGLLSGYRHPWYTSLDAFIVHGFIGGAIGAWLLARFRPRLSACPYVHFKRAFLALLIITPLLGIVNTKLLVEPAAALLLLSLALLVRPAVVRLGLLMLSPVWMFRLLFPEWSELLFRMVAGINSTPIVNWLAVNGIAILFYSIFVCPFLFGALAVIRDTPSLRGLPRRFRSLAPGIGLAAVYAVMTVWLAVSPVYNSLWQRDIRVSERYDLATGTPSFTLRSSEFLRGLRVGHPGGDTVLSGRHIIDTIEPRLPLDTGWVHVTHLKKDTTGATISIEAPRRPYTVTVSYSCRGKALRAFSSPWQYRNDKVRTTLRWEAFPEMPLLIPVSFNTGAEGGPINETIEVEFDSLVYPMTFRWDSSYVIPRTIFADTTTYCSW